ncbi:hypothetical protein DFP72DRAFT_1165610 [Ephemerocybe angulata]|uniref:Nephrocystin 3-like N-terminal domain-containing protein n=1 Tax=Ephemerocybe angulata TaxID=980116 RepID=A0A8H6M9Q7_9AGAR|nr:hypothetical protein DFP72DRAFT_1165610 [Tulosesus angulatus]
MAYQEHDSPTNTGSLSLGTTPTHPPVEVQRNVQPTSGSNNDSLHSGPTFFPNAQAFQLERLEYTHTAHHHYGPKQASVDGPGWKLLIENSAPNALYDSAVRFDPPRCDEDTRVEVTYEIMDWIQNREAPNQLLCMTGAAGSGKSALQQTISERCAELDILAAAFFFNVGDTTRNNLSGFVPTIAYQLGQKHPFLREAIGAAVEYDPLIFGKALKTQLEILIVQPVNRFFASRNPSEPDQLPFALLIDGLDECKGEARQRELLVGIQECLLQWRTPFRVFLASRPEMAIYEALNEGGHLEEAAYHIRLSDDYDATADIRRTMQRRLHEIGLRRRLKKGWFTERDIEDIVRAASGQYIYAATLLRYIAEPRGSPTERLRTALTWTSDNGQKTKKKAGPFASLDLLYTNIVSNAKEAFEAADEEERDFLLILNCIIWINKRIWGYRLRDYEKVYLLELGTCEIIFCDLRSLISVTDKVGAPLQPYHKSFFDFLEDEDRAGDAYVPRMRVVEHLARCLLDRMSEISLEDIYRGYHQDIWGRGPGGRNYEGSVNKSALPFFGYCLSLLIHPDRKFLGDSFVKRFILFIKEGGLEKMNAYFIAPDNRAQYIPETTRELLDGTRRQDIRVWRAQYYPWILACLKETAPDLTSVLKEYKERWDALSP